MVTALFSTNADEDDPLFFERRLTIGRVYARSLALLWRRLDLFLVLAILLSVPFLLFQFTLFPSSSRLAGDDQGDPAMKIILDRIKNMAAAANDTTTTNQQQPHHTNDNDPWRLDSPLVLALYTELFSVATPFVPIVGLIGQAAIVVAVGQMYIHGHPPDLI
jgi:hypothetical protein